MLKDNCIFKFNSMLYNFDFNIEWMLVMFLNKIIKCWDILFFKNFIVIFFMFNYYNI